MLSSFFIPDSIALFIWILATKPHNIYYYDIQNGLFLIAKHYF